MAITVFTNADHNYKPLVGITKITRHQPTTTHYAHMKKIKTRLQLTKTTVRVLRDSELAAAQGGGGGLLAGRASTNDPTACFVSGGDTKKL